MTKFSGSQQSQLAQIGAFLREKREQQGKSLQDIAGSTYIRPQLLSGIETGDPGLLPEPIFVQGFIRRYAETLGLKGIELSEQFTVDSIPSTPRPTKVSAPEDSSTTRLTRLTPKRPFQSSEADIATSASNASEVPVFAGETLSSEQLPEQPPVTAAPAFDSDTKETNSLEFGLEPALSKSDTSEDIPVGPLSSELSDSLNVFDFSDSSDNVVSKSDASSFEESGSVDDDAGEKGLLENGSLTNGSSNLPRFETTDVKTADAVSSTTAISKADSVEIETPVGQSLDDEPSPFVSDLPLAKKAPASGQLSTPPISYTSSAPLGSDASADTPNLKPFAIGAVLVAALTAGIVVLANVLGGEPSPTVAESPTPTETVEPEESALPTLPEPEPAPPVSDAPLFLEVEVTEPAWTSVTADGGDRLFEGTLNPGDRVIWEAQNSISVFSGNPGGLQISQNGQPVEVLGESGIPSGKDYSVE